MCLASVEYGELHGVCAAIGMAVDKNTELLQGPEWRAEAGARCAMMIRDVMLRTPRYHPQFFRVLHLDPCGPEG